MNNLPKGHRQGIWRIDRGANRIAHDRMRDALNAFLGDEKSTSLTNLLLGQGRDIEQAANVDHGIKGGNRSELTEESDLNLSQNEALNAAITRRLTLIQGPPGTGKTHTAVRILRRWSLEGNAPILAVAESNVAVDNLLQGLLAIGVDAVRLGQPVKVRESLREATLDARMERHRLQKDLKAIIDLNENLARKISGLKGKEKGLAHKDLNRGWGEARRIEQQMKEDILNTAKVICATCIGSGHDILEGRRFPRVLIDEATQATEPATLVPITRGCRQLVLVGDHRQLPPTVISKRAEKGGLGISLFDRMRGLGVHSIMLKEQYRMHPIISQFPSMQYYNNALIDGVQAEERLAPTGLIWPDFERPVAFLPIEGGEVVAEDGHSRANPAEASWVVRILSMLLDPGDLNNSDIGVITPYNGQVRAILDLLEQAGGTMLGDRWHGVEVRSVDGYQGREKEVIILSTVRSNSEGEIGFLDDARRLNVAITRAKRGLIVIGDPNTLRNQRDWDFWLTWAQERNLMAWHLLHM
jgi:superfamily I DNA and/or RNA helicase